MASSAQIITERSVDNYAPNYGKLNTAHIETTIIHNTKQTRAGQHTQRGNQEGINNKKPDKTLNRRRTERSRPTESRKKKKKKTKKK